MADVNDILMEDSAASKEEKQDDLPEDSISEDPKSKPEGQSEVNESNVYRYIKEDLFTSEIYKVEIRNLPKFVGFNDLKKFLAKHGLNPHKIKLFGKQTFAFVTFKNEDERDKAMKMVHGMQWKGQVLAVRLAKPKADPILRKRKQQGEGEGAGQPSAKRPEAGDKEEPLSVQIANVVTPLWNVPYEEQLKRKEEEVVAVLQRLAKWVSSHVYRFYKTTLLKILFIVSSYLTKYSTFVREIGNTNKAMLPWLFAQKGKYNKMCCPLEPIRPSPAQVYLHKNTLISDAFLPKKSLLFMYSVLTDNGNSLCLSHGRQRTGTSVNFSSPWVQMVKIRPSASAWENTKVDLALLSGPMTRATSHWRPKGWCASFRSSSGNSIWLSKSRTELLSVVG